MAVNARLQRGRAYRTDNRVLTFDIVANKVTATIRGNINPYFGVTEEPRYKISLSFNLISVKFFQSILARQSISKLSNNRINTMPLR